LESLTVDINQAIELPSSSLIHRLGIVCKTGSSIIQRVDKELGRGTSSTTRSQVTREPFPVAILVFIEVKQLLEVIFESKVEGLEENKKKLMK
jgi:hypothetical protein